MTDPTCPIADSDTEARYLVGSLSAEEAEAFEEHYFGCDICWRALQRGAEIRSVLARDAGDTRRQEPLLLTPAPPRLEREQMPQGPRGRNVWWPLLAAAAVMVVVTGLWRLQRPMSDTRLSVRLTIEPTRGGSAPLAISATATDKSLGASWIRAVDARTYRVRLLADDGRLLFDREIPDTSIVVSMDSLVHPEPKGAIYWQVEALNDLRVIVAIYELKEARPSR